LREFFQLTASEKIGFGSILEVARMEAPGRPFGRLEFGGWDENAYSGLI